MYRFCAYVRRYLWWPFGSDGLIHARRRINMFIINSADGGCQNYSIKSLFTVWRTLNEFPTEETEVEEIITDGQITKPYGPSLRMNGMDISCSRQNITIGKANTSVLPLPVYAIPIRSRPDRLETQRHVTVIVEESEVPTQMECLAFEWVWADWSSSLSTRSEPQPVVSYPEKKTVHESDVESKSSYLEPTQRWRNIFAVHVDIVKLSDSLMTFFGHAKNLAGCSPTKTTTSSMKLRTMVPNTYLVRMGSVYSTPLANSPAPIRARHWNQVRVCFQGQCSDVTFRFSQISKHLLFFFKDFIRSGLFRCIWREIACREFCSEYVSRLLWIFFNSLIWSSKVKLACGPTVISSAAAWLFPSDPDGCLLLSPLPWPPCIPPITLCNYKRNRQLPDWNEFVLAPSCFWSDPSFSSVRWIGSKWQLALTFSRRRSFSGT